MDLGKEGSLWDGSKNFEAKATGRKTLLSQAVVVLAFNPNTQEAEAGGSL